MAAAEVERSFLLNLPEWTEAQIEADMRRRRQDRSPDPEDEHDHDESEPSQHTQSGSSNFHRTPPRMHIPLSSAQPTLRSASPAPPCVIPRRRSCSLMSLYSIWSSGDERLAFPEEFADLDSPEVCEEGGVLDPSSALLLEDHSLAYPVDTQRYGFSEKPFLTTLECLRNNKRAWVREIKSRTPIPIRTDLSEGLIPTSV